MRPYLLATACLAASLLRAEPASPSLSNPGFEGATLDWIPSAEDIKFGLSKVTSEAARCGQKGLRVDQAEGGPGSWIQSKRTAVKPGVRYRIEFWARTINTSGVGVWVNFFEENWTPIPAPPGPQLAVQVPAEAPEWTAYHIDVVAPANADSVTLAVHCYSKRPTMADFDDFTITPLSTPAPGTP
ncbi:MAG: carbohydrate binding domain-containing protein [Rariglobus sp.]|nr:carbohydrate binding domain-containing protein [Rariglobus sp.]